MNEVPHELTAEEIENCTIHKYQISGSVVPNSYISFHNKDQKEVGRFDFNGPQMVFVGNADESARTFIDCTAQYFQYRLNQEWNEAIDAAVVELKAVNSLCDALVERLKK